MRVEDDIIFRRDDITVAIEEKSSPAPGVSILQDGLLDEIEMEANTAVEMAVAILQTCAPWKLR